MPPEVDRWAYSSRVVLARPRSSGLATCSERALTAGRPLQADDDTAGAITLAGRCGAGQGGRMLRSGAGYEDMNNTPVNVLLTDLGAS